MKKQKDRLVELIGSKVCEEYSPNCDEYEPHTCEKCYANFCKVGDLADAILADGWMRPPCKVGDTSYFLIEDTVAGKKYISPEPIVDVCTKGFYTSGHADSEENGDLWLWSDVGEIVFFTKEETEAKLKEGVADA